MTDKKSRFITPPQTPIIETRSNKDENIKSRLRARPNQRNMSPCTGDKKDALSEHAIKRNGKDKGKEERSTVNNEDRMRQDKSQSSVKAPEAVDFMEKLSPQINVKLRRTDRVVTQEEHDGADRIKSGSESIVKQSNPELEEEKKTISRENGKETVCE